MVFLYFVYIPNKNASRTDLTDDDQKAYLFAPTYVDGSTSFHRHMISVVVFSSSKQIQSMLVGYAVNDMGFFGDYSGAAPLPRTMKGNGITTFLFHVANVSLSIKRNLLQQHLLPRHG